jgi:hypothetical protein
MDKIWLVLSFLLGVIVAEVVIGYDRMNDTIILFGE